MALATSSIRLLRLSPALCSSMTLMFALDEHLIFGTWVQPPVRTLANSALPAWWTRGGLRWGWVLIIFYPANYILGTLNLLVPGDDPAGSTKWYWLGLLFSIAHMLYLPMALRRIAAIEKGVPKGNVAHSMEAWLKMNWVRALITDLPAWLCFIVAALKALEDNEEEAETEAIKAESDLKTKSPKARHQKHAREHGVDADEEGPQRGVRDACPPEEDPIVLRQLLRKISREAWGEPGGQMGLY
ncbi:uncharacterized protein E0L32_000509 [Thyridium curvatum]|uniref:Uncharacterized protein n=1 Tax=Thyridium curvatum TaxID=1093900 RepID=A0A507ATH5_9PEZI|nr:uncharacterized protein E0L32_000509 [Thyridium curvatum]TPX14115.1 hypothetical protein E0L32_000509 [Thyridium curvatum]